MLDLSTYLHERKKRIDEMLLHILEGPAGADRIKEAMRYCTLAAGKRIRPILCLAAIDALAGDSKTDAAVKVACALELIHTYSLIHDDLPAMDNDQLRRGKKTCHVAYDEATAILAGDALLTLAFQTLAEIHPRGEIRASILAEIIRTLSLAAGYRGMIAGQMLDIASEGVSLSLEDLEAMYRLKTGALFEASIQAGAVLAKADAEQSHKLLTYARSIGLAFQISDDILNIKGDPALTGKSTGTDALRQKSTYPSVVGIEKAEEKVKQLVHEALEALSGFDQRSDPLRAIAKFIIDRKR